MRMDWKKHFASLNNDFLIHVGSATPKGVCSEIAYMRTQTSLSFSPVEAFSLPGNEDYPVSCCKDQNFIHIDIILTVCTSISLDMKGLPEP